MLSLNKVKQKKEKGTSSVHFLDPNFAALVTFAFADEEIVVERTRPLEFDSALEDDFRLRQISVFEALRDFRRLRVSW